MKITALRLLPAESPAPGAPDCLLEAEADDGCSACVEVEVPAAFEEVAVPLDELEGALEELGAVALGQEPLERGALWERLAQPAGWYEQMDPAAAAVLSALDLALHELAARQAGLPLWRLLGGRYFSRLDTYLPCLLETLPDQPPPGGLRVDSAGDPEAAVAAVESLRSGWGEGPRLLVDLRGECRETEAGLALARRLQAAEVFCCLDLFPVSCGREYAELSPQVEVPLGAGAAGRGLRDWLRLLRTPALDLLALDLRRCGGISGAQRLTALAAAERKPVVLLAGRWAPTLLAAAHLAATSGWYLPPARPEGDLLDPPPAVREGFLELPSAPGLGAELFPAAREGYRARE